METKRVAPEWGCNPFWSDFMISMGPVSLVSSQRWLCIDADARCKQALRLAEWHCQNPVKTATVRYILLCHPIAYFKLLLIQAWCVVFFRSRRCRDSSDQHFSQSVNAAIAPYFVGSAETNGSQCGSRHTEWTKGKSYVQSHHLVINTAKIHHRCIRAGY